MQKLNLKYSTILTSSLGLILFLLSVFPNKIKTGQITIPNLIPIGILILVIVIVYGYIRKHITFKFNKITALFVLLYIIYLIGLGFSDFPDVGAKYLEYKLSLVIFPLLLMIQTKEPISLENTFIGLVIGCVVGALIGIYHGYVCYQDASSFNCFLSSSVSVIIHPTYFSVYTTIAIIALWIGYFKNFRFFTLTTVILLTLFLAIYTIFMMSLTGMLYLGLIIFGALLIAIYRYWKMIGVIGFIVATPVLLLMSYKFIPQVQHEIDDVIYYGKRYMDNSDNYFESLYYPYSGTESRLIMWKISLEQLKETPFGLGTGDVDHALQQRMEGQLHEEFVARNLNSHNQFLQTGLEIGFIGIIILILIPIFLSIEAIKNRDLLLFATAFSFLFNCLFESMLQRQSGVVFYVLVFCILTIPYSVRKSNE